MKPYYSLYGRLLDQQVLYDAFRKVRRNKGAAGIDGQSIGAFEAELDGELVRLLNELKAKRYQPQPVKRVTLSKPDGGERLLGIPTVRDRVVQQAVKAILEPIFDGDFHPSSYGYRPKASAHQAISKAQLFIRRYQRRWAVDMDLSKCFDTLDHDLIIRQFRCKVTDGSILGLLKQWLDSGVMIGHWYEASDRGSPQGGVISPLIANVYLDAFDQYMMSRGHRIVRYADDILILCNTRTTAQRVQKVATAYLENELKLTVNRKKTHLAHSHEGIRFLGVVIHTHNTRIQPDKLASLKAKLKAITRRNTGMNLPELVSTLNPILRGFIGYFRIANCKKVMETLMSWLRRRLRCIQLKQWKTPKRLHRRLKQLGYKPPFQSIKMQSWRNASSRSVHHAIPNRVLHNELGLFNLGVQPVGQSVPV